MTDIKFCLIEDEEGIWRRQHNLLHQPRYIHNSHFFPTLITSSIRRVKEKLYISWSLLIALCVCVLDVGLWEPQSPLTEFTHSHWSNSLSHQTPHQTVAWLRETTVAQIYTAQRSCHTYARRLVKRQTHTYACIQSKRYITCFKELRLLLILRLFSKFITVTCKNDKNEWWNLWSASAAESIVMFCLRKPASVTSHTQTVQFWMLTGFWVNKSHSGSVSKYCINM